MTELAVREGDLVKQGQLIARLDSAQLEQQHVRDQAAVASAQSSCSSCRPRSSIKPRRLKATSPHAAPSWRRRRPNWMRY